VSSTPQQWRKQAGLATNTAPANIRWLIQVSTSLKKFPSIHRFHSHRHLGFFGTAHAHQLVSGEQNSLLAMHFALQFAHQLMCMCVTKGPRWQPAMKMMNNFSWCR
jgi:hypothetical protein